LIVLAVAIGGSLGALSRYHLERFVAQRQSSPFPLSTLLINVSGSTALGALVAGVSTGHLPVGFGLLAGTGFLGGYTTFSTFTYETLKLIEDRAWRYAAWNLMLSGPLSFGGAAAAYFVTKASL